MKPQHIRDNDLLLLDTQYADAEAFYPHELDWNDTLTSDEALNDDSAKTQGYGWLQELSMWVKIIEEPFEDDEMPLFDQDDHKARAWSAKPYAYAKKTSDSNPLKPAYIEVGQGKLGLFICPAKVGAGISGDHERDLHKDLSVLRDHGMTRLYGLMPEYELIEYKADGLLRTCRDYGIMYLHRGWTDRSTPDNNTFSDDVKQAAAAVWSGEIVGVHCRGGLGRTGTFAGCVLAELGFHVDDIMQKLKDARGYLCPETEAQKLFVKTYAVRRMIDRGNTLPIKDATARAIEDALLRAI